jgi:Platelet-activating factor acetylhydrolase, isoform II
MRTLWQDLRYGARTLSKKPGFTLIAVLTLALGIGVNTALFTVFDAFVLKPLPLKDPDSIVKIYGRMPDGNRYRLFSYLDYLDYRDRNHVFDGLVAFNKVAGETAPYIDNLDKLAGAIDQIQINIARTVQTHSIAGAKISSAEGRYPVLIFSPGNQMNVALYAAQIEDLASHGHIVVGMDHPYESLGVLYPDGRVARYSEENRPKQGSPNFQEEFARFYRRRVDWRAADAGFVLNQLEKLDAGKTLGQFSGRSDLARVGAFGHSIGGVAAAQTCQSDRRFKACLNLDGKAKSLSFFPDADGKALSRRL